MLQAHMEHFKFSAIMALSYDARAVAPVYARAPQNILQRVVVTHPQCSHVTD